MAATGMAANLGASVWNPYKELYSTVQAAIFRKQPDAIQDLEIALRKHKPDFISLLKYAVKNVVDRDAVKKATTQGISLQGQQSTQTLSQPFIDEALIISDLFNLNEYAAVELLVAGENHLPYYPGLTRGLVAVLLYYDGQRSLVGALRSLILAREGRTFTLGLGEELAGMATKFTDQIMSEGLTDKILELIKGIDLTAVLDKLQKARALGNAKHRKQVTDVIKEVRLGLAECLFSWSCQTPLSKENTLMLIRHLRNDASSSADGTIDPVTLALLMALLYSLDVRILDQEDAEEIVQRLPVIEDQTFVRDVHKEITSLAKWESPKLRGVVRFAWALALQTLAQHSPLQGMNEYCEDDEVVMDMAIEDEVFSYLKNAVVSAPVFHKEEFYVRQLHSLLTDFIVQMPLKVKELRNRGDETARIVMAHAQEGLMPPADLRRDFQHLLELVGMLYGKDPLKLELALEFWCPPEPSAATGAGTFTTLYHYRPPQRQISLYKFVRLAGDLLLPALYIPYIEMLTGLANGPQCSHHCFNLLKTNGMSAGGPGSTVSWDHFFMSLNQYYMNLRQEAPATSDMAHVYRPHPRNITQQEMDGLIVVLRLVKQVALQDESARVALVENQQWLATVVLLGLVGCSVPPALKSELLLTLAALAGTAEIAVNMWHSLEMSQLIPTVPSTTNQPGGIKVELDEVEARNEEFPITRGFLALLNVLTDVPVPAGLGAGYRSQGARPYLDFVRDSVLLRFDTRAYKDPAEKWQVAAGCLQILYKLLKSHEIFAENFLDQTVEIQGGGTALADNPPGHIIMVHMLNDSAFLEKVLFIVDEATKLLDQYHEFPGKEALEQCSLLCLQLLDTALTKQQVFLDMLRDSGASLIVDALDKLLLLGINLRSGKADHIVNVAKYVMYNSFIPEHALYAVKILCQVCQSSVVQPQLVGLFSANETVCRELLHGFVECLETDELEEEENAADDPEEEITTSHICNFIRQTIMQLLVTTLDHPAPNLAHLLLGFEYRKPVNKTNLQDPGVLGSPRTCLHSVLLLLNKGVGTRTGPQCLYETPCLAELAYHLIYVLCANKDTSSATMRYLRTTHDFLYRQVQHVPFQLTVPAGDNQAFENSLLNQQSWLLKTAAIELRLTSANRQRSHTQKLINLLLEDNPAQFSKVLQPDGTFEPEYTQYDMEQTGLGASHMFTQQAQCRRKILSILDSIDFRQNYTGPLQLEFFDPSVIEQVLQSCEQKNEFGVSFYNAKLLYRILVNELNKLQWSAAAGQRPLVGQEIQDILANVVKRNSVLETVHAKQQAFESWRQLVEIVLTACPMDLLQGENRQSVLFEILQDLLLKVSDEEAVPELTTPVAGVILTLMSNLRQCFLVDESDIGQGSEATQYIPLLDVGTTSSASQSSIFGLATGARTLFASSLQVTLKALLEHVVRSSSGQQRVRANLYGSLLFYLQIAQKPRGVPQLDPVGDKGVGMSITNKDSEFDKLVQENLANLNSYGDQLMDIICRDACDGHQVGRMLALSVLDAVVMIDHQQLWLRHLHSKGYLHHLVESILHEDKQLQAALSPNPEELKALYIYESKMGLLTRVAETAVGAHMLLQCNVMSCLAECVVYSMRPQENRYPPGVEDYAYAGFIPTVRARYQQILFPALKLCLAVLTSLGIENRQASNKVLQFLMAHNEVFQTILRDRHSSLNLPTLQELALVTAVISRAATDGSEINIAPGDSAAVEMRGLLSRIQRQMIGLLPKYCVTEKLMNQVKNLEAESGPENRDMRALMRLAIEDITSNVVTLCRNTISKSASTAHYGQVLFGPSLAEATIRDWHEEGTLDFQTTVCNVSRSPNLGIIVMMLKHSTNQFLTVFDTHKQQLRKLTGLADLSSEELKELCDSSGTDKMSTQQRQQLARKQLTHTIAYKGKELQHFAYIIENCLFILWRHLDFYLVHCVPADQDTSLFQLHSHRAGRPRRLHDISREPFDDGGGGDVYEPDINSSISTDMLDQLKMDAVTCINETLLKKLNEIEQCYMKRRTRYGFVEALVRRLKRLLRLHTGVAS